MNTPPTYDIGLIWFRRDLRVYDNAALHLALTQCAKVYCVFIFDKAILEPLPRADRRVEFIRESLVALDNALRQLSPQNKAGLIVRHAMASDEIPALAATLKVQAVFAARDYEPQAITRDTLVQQKLSLAHCAFITCKDQVIFEGREVLTQSGTPYGVFTPYKNNWLARLTPQDVKHNDSAPLAQHLHGCPPEYQKPVPSLSDLGFESTNLSNLKIPTGEQGGQALLKAFFEHMDSYHTTRDFPAIKGPSYLGIHLRFGTVSIRQLVQLALQRQTAGSTGAGTWLNELVWRDFYFAILANFPHVTLQPFKPEYAAIQWESGSQAQALFHAWCTGQTGYPLVDAAMAQINQTGYMHNRLRMVAGSFLVKDLGLDWRWGERYFAEKLNDFDLSANNGGWQWVASSGCDAQPYFRIFNPVSQSEKFDPQGKFIRRYLPQLAKLSNTAIHAPWLAKPLELQAASVTLGVDYPQPLVQHNEARAQTLARYAVVKKKAV
ncbi:deoxyribodipyrimidine photo-lyase [Rhodoferax lithotrophicus]|uniref:Deoxyribodipyrimidine photo-lyase n=1 Tax=Rhodoferax lithotrophicus TaxID=2798804 RepID=A0ABM7MIJ8_9BURK|nr:deoxyribodipyrimidine photo-lyase [Rhodoferax sp. MIZ03]BCO26036.1 deoxyribodipyrimidine photo-lyase [Rhodoferax sp. MIZ03]